MIAQQRSRIASIAVGVLALLLVSGILFTYWSTNRAFGVNQLWQREFEHKNLEGKIVTVKGEMIFEPLSDFRFNAIYLVDAETPISYRSPSHGFWFGIRIADVSCKVEVSANMMTCEPFDPNQATMFEFKGTVHLKQVGKKEIMWLSDIDFEHSRQLIHGKWEPIPVGEFTIPLGKN
jgi:hypothetical protein